METKDIYNHLKENDLLYKSIVNRVDSGENKGDYSLSDETAFFAEILSMFSDEQSLPVDQLKSFSAFTIIDYLKKTHNYYLNKKLPEIELLLEQLQNSSRDLPEYLSGMVGWLQKNMEKHFRVEEQSLFPYIIELEQKVRENTTPADIKNHLRDRFKDFSIQRFIENHHDDVENKLSDVKKHIIRSLHTKDELFPYRILLLKLDELEKDLRLHARVEDDVLIPKGIQMEENLSI